MTYLDEITINMKENKNNVVCLMIEKRGEIIYEIGEI